MKKTLFALLAALISALPAMAAAEKFTSPNGHVTMSLQKNGGYWYIRAERDGTTIARVKLGLETETQKFDGDLTLESTSEPSTIAESYTAVHGKCSHPVNEATAVTYRLVNAQGQPLDVEARAYNDGLAFRYIIPGDGQTLQFCREATEFLFPGLSRRWLQRFVTSYEEDFPLQEGSGRQGDWNYPALFLKGDTYALLTEAGVDGSYCNTHLNNSANSSTYAVSYPYAWEGNGQGSVYPVAATPWASPWRVLIMGTLADVFASTLVEDVSPASRIADPSWIEPGGAAWVYWAYNHGSRDYKICREYVDLAARMGWKYVLIDWEWDVMGNGGNIEDIIAYASSLGIKTMLWYNSGGTHNNVGGGPRDRLLTHQSRCREFEYLRRLGVAGIKIDFFESDKQDMIKYYHDILADAADYGMLIVYHGCTAPRGWSRTYPNLMTMEAVFGAEQYNNGDIMTSIAPRLNCTLPFTRNVVGPMDYTPVAFTDSQHPHLTTYAHELALSVVFESGIQHWADRPAGFLSLSTLARMHMSAVPVAWDESRLLQGAPGTDCVVARRSGEVWYVGGLNGEDTDKTYDIDLDFLEAGRTYMATIMGDGADYDIFSIHNRLVTAGDRLNLATLGRGGFAIDIREIGHADLDALRRAASDAVEDATGGEQTCDPALLEALLAALADAQTVGPDAPDAAVCDAFITLGDALSALECRGTVRNGAVSDIESAQIITRHYLGEARNFSRSDTQGRGPRFGVPRDWTVENFCVVNADIGGQGDKGGIDRYAGDNTLSLGVWNDASKAVTDISKAMIHRSIELPAGSYYFGAAYQTVSSDEEMYIYAADRPLLSSQVKDHAISYHSLSQSSGNGRHYGVYFTLDAPRQVTLGWSGDLTTSGQKEFRAREVVLLRLDGLCPDEAIIPGEATEIGVAEFARHLDATNIVGDSGEALLQINGNTVEVGRVVMDGVRALTLCCTSITSIKSAAKVEVFVDDNPQPMAVCAVDSHTDPAAITVTLPELRGVHNLRLRLAGADYRLRSVVLSAPDGIGDVLADPARPTGAWRIDGVQVDPSSLAPGIYIIDGKVVKR